MAASSKRWAAILLVFASGAASSQTVPAPQPRTAWDTFHSQNPAPVPSSDQKLTDPILKGAIDLHAHFGPDAYPRQWDAFEIARLMAARGMRGMVLKNHFSESAGTANLVRKHAGVPGLEVFGGLALNSEVGGINPEAVRYFAAVEGHYARIVWMPTHESEHEVTVEGAARPIVRVSDRGTLLPEVLAVLDVIREKHLVLATGHVTADEMLMIMAEARKRGIGPIIVTHPNMGPRFTNPSLDQLRQAVALSGYVEFVASELLGPRKAEFIATIRAIGPAHCFVSSDSGLVGSPNHADALVLSIRVLRAAGFGESELDLMFRRNPAMLVGLKPWPMPKQEIAS